MLPVVAIVGRPNVGKSSLFNKLVGERISIVEDTPGVTRDRIYGRAEWCGRTFTLVDTGGLEPYSGDVMLTHMRAQAEVAIAHADVILFVTDVRTGLTAADGEVAAMLQRSRKPVLVCVNKCDTAGALPAEFYEFYNLGLGELFAISATHGMGTGDLLDELVKLLPPAEEEEEEDRPIRVAVIGRPNAGKSSLINRLLGDERMLVTNIAGTTRDAVDSPLTNQHGSYVFVDTAGIRRAGKIDTNVEKYSVLRTKMAVERADVCLTLVDAAEGITAQDTTVAGIAHEAGKASVLVVNKWDLPEKDDHTFNEFRTRLRQEFAYMDYAPDLFISAKTGQRTDKLFGLINSAYAGWCQRISTGLLNEVLHDALLRTPPPSDKGRRLKIFYMTQSSACPPTFVLFVNDAQLCHFSYVRYLENRLRETFGFQGTPIRFVIRAKGEDGGKE